LSYRPLCQTELDGGDAIAERENPSRSFFVVEPLVVYDAIDFSKIGYE
jgi:hypothetical protein